MNGSINVTAIVVNIASLVIATLVLAHIVFGNISAIQSEISDVRLGIAQVDHKIDAIGDMTVLAFSDGEITGDELELIWGRVSSQGES